MNFLQSVLCPIKSSAELAYSQTLQWAKGVVTVSHTLLSGTNGCDFSIHRVHLCSSSCIMVTATASREQTIWLKD